VIKIDEFLISCSTLNTERQASLSRFRAKLREDLRAELLIRVNRLEVATR